MSSYFYFIKIRFLLALAYRFDVILSMSFQIIYLGVNFMLWTALYGGRGSGTVVAGTTLEQMLTYSVMSTLMWCFMSGSVEEQLKSKVRSGDVALDFIKPINVFGMYFADDIGNVITKLVQRFIPLLVFSSLVFIAPVPHSLTSLLLFFISVMFSFFINWFIGALLGLMNFWVIDNGPIGPIVGYIFMFLSGAIFPTWFFPEPVQKVLSFLPFVYVHQYPISIFLGKTSYSEALSVLAIQLFWSVAFFALFLVVSKRAGKRVMVQGG